MQTAVAEEPTPVVPTLQESLPQTLVADNSTEPEEATVAPETPATTTERTGVQLIAGRMVVVETAGLVAIAPHYGPQNEQGTTSLGCVVQQSELVDRPERGAVGTFLVAMADLLSRRRKPDFNLLSMNE